MTDSQKPVIMGILNITPDSFSDGGRYTDLDAAIEQANAMVAEGADIIDIGGESTRPGAQPVSAGEQLRRVIPVISALHGAHPQLPISIDTTLSEVADAALQAGASIINDVSAGQDDAAMLALAAASEAKLILMHMQGTPLTMQDHPHYHDVLAEVLSALQERVDSAQAVGVRAENIIIDPGIGFGKRRDDNLTLLANLNKFVATGLPVLLGTSRKRFMGGICRVESPAELVTATAVTTGLGVMAGVRWFRVHDIKANRQAADIAWAISRAT